MRRRASAFKKVSSTTTLAIVSMPDLIRGLQNVTACLRAHELWAPGLESPRALEQPKLLSDAFILIARQAQQKKRRERLDAAKESAEIHIRWSSSKKGASPGYFFTLIFRNARSNVNDPWKCDAFRLYAFMNHIAKCVYRVSSRGLGSPATGFSRSRLLGFEYED